LPSYTLLSSLLPLPPTPPLFPYTRSSDLKTARTSAMADNPFMQPSTLAFELPPFDRIRDSDYLPAFQAGMREQLTEVARIAHNPDRKSTRLNSSHRTISYAVFCLKKKNSH